VSYELTAITPQGESLIALAKTLAAESAAGAAKHDREGSYPFLAFAAL
jgi:hypothetical protein